MRKNVLLAVALILALLVGTNFILPIITGSSQLLIVLSGSMHPGMRVGDMVVVNSADADGVELGDVICFLDPGGDPNIMITHRVMSMEEGDERVFQTKGDANEEQDNYLVPASKLVGKMVFVIPFAGYLPAASKNSLLFLVTIILPASVLILDEVKKIIQASNPVSARKMEREKRKRTRQMPNVVDGRVLGGVALISLLLLMALVLPNLGGNGHTTLEEEYVFKNYGYLSSVSVITPDDTTQRLAIEPWYSVIPRTNESVVMSSSGPMDVGVTSVPYVLPVLWIILLAQIDPYLPAFFIIVLYSSLAIVLSISLWFRKTKTKGIRINLIIRRVSRSLRRFHLM